MKRILSDDSVEIIKVLLSKGYKNGSVRDKMFYEHKIEVSSSILTGIKRGDSYTDVRSDLNNALKKGNIKAKNYDDETIRNIKKELTNGTSEEEIMTIYKVPKRIIMNIRMCYGPFCNIAPEYNEEIEKRWRRKKNANINDAMVRAIKKEYVEKNGDILLAIIAKKHKICKETVSTILNFKYYKNVGSKYNSKIISIKKTQEDLKKEKQKIISQKKIEKEILYLEKLKETKNQILNKLMESKAKIMKLKEQA